MPSIQKMFVDSYTLIRIDSFQEILTIDLPDKSDFSVLEESSCGNNVVKLIKGDSHVFVVVGSLDHFGQFLLIDSFGKVVSYSSKIGKRNAVGSVVIEKVEDLSDVSF